MLSDYDTDEKRWQAVQARESAADDCFLYGVVTTGIYCYPSCPSRAALKRNTRFYANRMAAIADGMRPCRRCRSDEPPLLERQRQLVEKACVLISESVESVKVDALAMQLGVSRFHLQKLFRQFLQIGPKQYIKSVRAQRAANTLGGDGVLLEGVFEAGYDSSAAYYADGAPRLGMPARVYKRQGEGLHIRYAFGATRFGKIVVAATSVGVCSILFGESRKQLAEDLSARFCKATLVRDREALQQLVEQVVAGIEDPALAARLPLDIQGTAFQEKVWTALRGIAPGDTATYAEVAASIGQPAAARAVASACAANPVAVIVPCHRVLGAGSKLAGYRWGVDRKRRLLAYEDKH